MNNNRYCNDCWMKSLPNKTVQREHPSRRRIASFGCGGVDSLSCRRNLRRKRKRRRRRKDNKSKKYNTFTNLFSIFAHTHMHTHIFSLSLILSFDLCRVFFFFWNITNPITHTSHDYEKLIRFYSLQIKGNTVDVMALFQMCGEISCVDKQHTWSFVVWLKLFLRVRKNSLFRFVLLWLMITHK